MILFGYYFLSNLSIYRFFHAFMDIFVPCLIICVLFLPFALPQSRLRFGSFFFRSGIDQTSVTTPFRNSLCLHDLSTYLPLTYSTSQPGRKECFYPVYTRRSNTSTYKNTSFLSYTFTSSRLDTILCNYTRFHFDCTLSRRT